MSGRSRKGRRRRESVYFSQLAGVHSRSVGSPAPQYNKTDTKLKDNEWEERKGEEEKEGKCLLLPASSCSLLLSKLSCSTVELNRYKAKGK
jgi:hypothetical protein